MKKQFSKTKKICFSAFDDTVLHFLKYFLMSGLIEDS